MKIVEPKPKYHELEGHVDGRVLAILRDLDSRLPQSKSDPVAGSRKLAEREVYTIPESGPFTVTVRKAAAFFEDRGVSYADAPADERLVPVSSPRAPAEGQYSCDPATGVYTFAAADEGLNVRISYAYTDTADVKPSRDFRSVQERAGRQVSGSDKQA